MDKWDRHWLRTARETALNLSKDPRTKVGAVAVRDRIVLSTGYNGFPRGMEDLPERLANREYKNENVVHAEDNCFYNAARIGARLEDSELYVWGLPTCLDCAKGAIQTGIRRVIMCHEVPIRPDWQESCGKAQSRLRECGVEFRSYGFGEIE